MPLVGGCGSTECCASTGIHDDGGPLSGMTFGKGRLDLNGYWEFPCAPCARAFERAEPSSIPCWPFEGHEEEAKECFDRERMDELDKFFPEDDDG